MLNQIEAFIRKRYTAIIRVLLLMSSSMFLTLFVEWVVRNSLKDACVWAFEFPAPFLFTSVFYFFVSFFLFTLMRRIDIPIFIVNVLAFTLAVSSYFKSMFRSEPLYPWDLLIVGEAADISSEMKLIPTASMLIVGSVIILTFVIMLFSHSLLFKKKLFRKRKPDKKRKIEVGLQIAVSLAVVIFYTVFVLNNAGLMEIFGIGESAFRQAAAAKRNGFTQSFIMNTKYILPDKPDGYDKESVNEAVSEIDKKDVTALKPNIIYLMSESYADISLCENVIYHDDIFGATEHLKENYVSGTLLGAQFGGGTCNSEFEVLTGFSMRYLPTGCTPYQQYFNTETVSYPRYLKELGYNTVAIHSYGKQFWNRDVAYPNMGFDKFISEEDFENPLRRRGLIKDDELVKMIIKEYEANLETGKPFFNFSVSMQNHGSFTDGQYLENYRANLTCDALTDEQEGILVTYATGIRDANTALLKLIDYFSQVSEPTIICMFGDHLGSLGGNDDIYINSGYMGENQDDPKEAAKKYTTPFFVWDNFTDNNFTAPQISFYQLIPSICEWYDLDRPAFYDYLVSQQEYFRGAALDFYIDDSGEIKDKLPEEAKEYYQRHKLLQYDLMFGEKYSAEKIYSPAK